MIQRNKLIPKGCSDVLLLLSLHLECTITVQHSLIHKYFVLLAKMASFLCLQSKKLEVCNDLQAISAS